MTNNCRSGMRARESSLAKRLRLSNLILAFSLCLCFSAIQIFGQTGGPYDLTRSVIAGGGESASTGGAFSVSGTVGQNAAGTTSTSSPARFDLHDGFWFQNPLAPTSANVAISGRVTNALGQGIRNARITVTGGPVKGSVTVTTGAFGSFVVEGLRAGENYVVTVASQRNTFAVPSRVIYLADSVSDVDFVSVD